MDIKRTGHYKVKEERGTEPIELKSKTKVEPTKEEVLQKGLDGPTQPVEGDTKVLRLGPKGTGCRE